MDHVREDWEQQQQQQQHADAANEDVADTTSSMSVSRGGTMDDSESNDAQERKTASDTTTNTITNTSPTCSGGPAKNDTIKSARRICKSIGGSSSCLSSGGGGGGTHPETDASSKRARFAESAPTPKNEEESERATGVFDDQDAREAWQVTSQVSLPTSPEQKSAGSPNDATWRIGTAHPSTADETATRTASTHARAFTHPTAMSQYTYVSAPDMLDIFRLDDSTEDFDDVFSLDARRYKSFLARLPMYKSDAILHRDYEVSHSSSSSITSIQMVADGRGSSSASFNGLPPTLDMPGGIGERSNPSLWSGSAGGDGDGELSSQPRPPKAFPLRMHYHLARKAFRRDNKVPPLSTDMKSLACNHQDNNSFFTTAGMASGTVARSCDALFNARRQLNSNAVLGNYAISPRSVHPTHRIAHYSAASAAHPPPEPVAESSITLGVCCMKKKMESSTMQAMLQRFEELGLVPICFDENMILHSPVAEWPVVDVMICFYSSGYPLHKAISYAEMHPYIYYLTNPASQSILLDRRDVYGSLKRNNVPVLPHLICSRDGYHGDLIASVQENVEEEYIVVNGKRMDKPFVEKPVDSEDHNVYIYFDKKSGGGGRRLFRKQKNTSSMYDPELSRVRRDGSYVYEQYVESLVDIKCYTVGEHFVHAEQRKAPTVDGIVLRDSTGKELRETVELTSHEMLAALKVVKVFRQVVCGFDIVRRADGSFYVIDVNGWSFVKNNQDYVEKATGIMGEIFREEVRKRGLHRNFHPDERSRVLCGVVGVVRHAERTPKQKIKLVVCRGRLLEVALESNPRARKEITYVAPHPKLLEIRHVASLLLAQLRRQHEEPEKSGLASKPTALEDETGLSSAPDKSKLAASPPAAATPSDEQSTPTTASPSPTPRPQNLARSPQSPQAKLGDHRLSNVMSSLRLIVEVIGGCRSGLKLQVNPKKWNVDGVCTEALFICKWGGCLTAAGIQQAATLGRAFSKSLYKPTVSMSASTASSRCSTATGFYPDDPTSPTLRTAGSYSNMGTSLERSRQRHRSIPSPSKDFAISAENSENKTPQDSKDTTEQQEAPHHVDPSKIFLTNHSISERKGSRSSHTQSTEDEVGVNTQLPKPVPIPTHEKRSRPTGSVPSLSFGVEHSVSSAQGLEWIHALSVKANNERRVIGTALSFSRQFLRSPFLAETCVTVDEALLGSTHSAKEVYDDSARELTCIMHLNEPDGVERVKDMEGMCAILSCPVLSAEERTPYGAVCKLHKLVSELIDALPSDLTEEEMHETHLYHTETLFLLRQRWETLLNAFTVKHKPQLVLDIRRIPMVFDNVSYDVCYNQEKLAPLDLYPLFTLAESLSSFVSEHANGITNTEKHLTGSLVSGPLVSRIVEEVSQFLDTSSTSEKSSLDDTWNQKNAEELSSNPAATSTVDENFQRAGNDPQSAVPTRLFFTSESHMDALKNALYYNGHVEFHPLGEPQELSFLSIFLLKVYRYPASGAVQIEVLFSTGMDKNMFGIVQEFHASCNGITPMIRIHNNLTIEDLRHIAASAEARREEYLKARTIVS